MDLLDSSNAAVLKPVAADESLVELLQLGSSLGGDLLLALLLALHCVGL